MLFMLTLAHAIIYMALSYLADYQTFLLTNFSAIF